MFRIATYLDRSPIHGTGVYTPFAIAAGSVIWQFDETVDWRITPAELAAFPEPYRSRMRDYCYVDEDGMHVYCGDNAKYMNHSEAPNCDDTGDRFTVARRDIAAGEELTCDYRTFDAESAATDGPLYGAGRRSG